MSELKEGQLAPDFTATTHTGASLSLAALKGKTVVLYFYPKDDTPGCTKEACGFRDRSAALEAKGAVILGVSADSTASHQKFITKYDLPFALLSDPDKELIQAYGAWGEKTRCGKTSMGILRRTVVIGPDGKIRKLYPDVKAEQHPEEILQLLNG